MGSLWPSGAIYGSLLQPTCRKSRAVYGSLGESLGNLGLSRTGSVRQTGEGYEDSVGQSTAVYRKSTAVYRMSTALYGSPGEATWSLGESTGSKRMSSQVL